MTGAFAKSDPAFVRTFADVGVGWSTLVAAELIAATRGVGSMILSGAQFPATDVVVVVGIGVIAACALAFSLGLRRHERWLLPWHGRG